MRTTVSNLAAPYPFDRVDRPFKAPCPNALWVSDFTYVVKWEGLVHPSDRGVRYVSIRYTERLADAGIEPPVASVGGSSDHAPAETVNGLYRSDVIHRRGPWRSLDAVEFATLEWVDWFNNRRLLEPIGNIPPAEAEKRHYTQIEAMTIAA